MTQVGEGKIVTGDDDRKVKPSCAVKPMLKGPKPTANVKPFIKSEGIVEVDKFGDSKENIVPITTSTTSAVVTSSIVREGFKKLVKAIVRKFLNSDG